MRDAAGWTPFANLYARILAATGNEKREGAATEKATPIGLFHDPHFDLKNALFTSLHQAARDDAVQLWPDGSQSVDVMTEASMRAGRFEDFTAGRFVIQYSIGGPILRGTLMITQAASKKVEKQAKFSLLNSRQVSVPKRIVETCRENPHLNKAEIKKRVGRDLSVRQFDKMVLEARKIDPDILPAGRRKRPS